MKKLFYVLVLVAALYIAAAMVTPGQQIATTSSAHYTVSLTAYVVTGKPSVSATFIDRVLCDAQSPACHTGQALYDDGLKYGIDAAYALAFFQHESSFGKYGVARVTLGLGNIRCSRGYRCIDGYRAYASWQAGYEDWYKLISQQYVQAWHLTTVDQIVPVYAPNSENDTAGYIAAIKASVSSWRSGQ